MKKYLYFIAITLFGTFLSPSFAQQMKISSGAKEGTYFTMVNQMLTMCNADNTFVNVVQPNGTPGTVKDIVDNKAAGGIVQFDAMWMRSQKIDLTSIKTLFPMHREQVHIIVMKKPMKKGGFMGVGGDEIVLKDTSSLKGLTVAASGGSVFSAEAINVISGIGYNIDTTNTTSQAILAALQEGKVHAGLFVGGAPMSLIANLPNTFRILPFDGATIEKLAAKEVYYPKTIAYDNLSISAVATVEVDALFVVNDYKGAKASANLNKFRECVKNNIDDLRENEGSHPAWRSVKFDVNAKPKWPVYVGKQ